MGSEHPDRAEQTQQQPGAERCRCGYPLKGLREKRCPECGRPFPAKPPAARARRASAVRLTGGHPIKRGILGRAGMERAFNFGYLIAFIIFALWFLWQLGIP